MPRQPSNVVLNALPADLRESLLARMQPARLPIGTVLQKPGERPSYVHFMTTGVASVVTYMSDGAGVEVGFIGREGIVEGNSLLGPAKTPSTAMIQVEGTGLRMRFDELQKELFSSPLLLHAVLESVQYQILILNQLAACNGLHEIEQRLARWLLMVQDRVDKKQFHLTQEFLAAMLGARRTSVTLAAGGLQRAGLIHYRRGEINILDSKGLEGAACECYPIVRDLVRGLFQHDKSK